MDNKKNILVYADWQEFKAPQLIGVLHSFQSRGKEVFSFEYDNDWLDSPFAQEIDPDIKLFSGTQYLHEKKIGFGAFLDSAPDRWGRVLMERREVISARMENRSPRKLNESDYLLGVYDELRMGGLRFKETESGVFLNDNCDFATPPITSISQLEQASYQLENDSFKNDFEQWQALQMLLEPGSSLGGARPKAGVKDKDGSLWIAKFPSIGDTHDVGAWEMVVNELAQKAGLNIAQAKAKKIAGKHHTFLTKRFDRTTNGKRLHFASAMTLLGYTDGINSQDGASYLELTRFISQKGANVNQDLKELFGRIVFSICVSNTDDHLRNHGFLLTQTGWTLSPAYDINPNPKGLGLKLNISAHDNSLDLNLATEVAHHFRLSDTQAKEIISNTIKVVSKWQSVAKKHKISTEEQRRMSEAFRRNFANEKM